MPTKPATKRSEVLARVLYEGATQVWRDRRLRFRSCARAGDDLSGSWWARVVSAEAWKEGDLRSNAAHGGDTGAIRAWKEGDLRSNAAHGGDTGTIRDTTYS